MSVPLASGIEAVKSGDAFKAAPSMGELADIGLDAASSAVDAITETWSAMTKNLSTTLSVTSSQVKVIELKAKSEGREPTPEELDKACGPLSFLTKAKNELEEALSGIFGQVEGFASEFGQTIASFANDLNTLIDDVANAVDEVAQEIAQAALDAFEAVNAVAMEALEAVEGAINSAVGFINDAVAEAEALLNSAIDEMLAFADSLNFASLFSLDCQEEAVANAVDSEKVADAAEVDRVIGPTVERESAPPTENLADIPVTSPTLAEPQTTLEPKTNREKLITYWVDPADKAAGTSIITFLTIDDAVMASINYLEPFGVPRFVKSPTGTVRKGFAIRNNKSGKVYVVLAFPSLIPLWKFYSLDGYVKNGGVVGPKNRARDGIIVPDPNVSIEEPTLEPIPVDASETVQTPNVEEIIQRTKTAISKYNQINKDTFALIQEYRRQEGVLDPQVAAGIKNAIKGNEETRTAIISGIASLPPSTAKLVQDAVGTIPPVLR